MNLLMTLLVRDESDIIRDNIEYHLSRGVRFFVITDNGSIDGSREIAEEYVRAGIAEIIDEKENNFNQTVWVTRMARLAFQKYHADWVIHADADEFWWPRSGDLASSLSLVPPDFAAVRCRTLHFLPRPGKRKALQRMVIRNRRPDKNKVCHRGMEDVLVGFGNHSLLQPDVKIFNGNPLFTVFHFPARSYEQYERKVDIGGTALLNNPNLTPEQGYHWRRRNEDFKNGTLSKYWQEYMELNTQKLILGILAGNLTIDRRLAHYIKSHKEIFGEAGAIQRFRVGTE